MDEYTGRRKPVNWIADQIAGISSTRLGHYFRDMVGLSDDPNIAHHVAQLINRRDQLPEVINMPENWGMIHFPQQGRHAARTFSSAGQVNPTPVALPEGNTQWRFTQPDRWAALTVGIDTQRGRHCLSGGCAPRAISGATGMIYPFDSIADDIAMEFQDFYTDRMISFKGADGPSEDQLDDFLESSKVEPKNAIGLLDFTSVYVPYQRGERETTRLLKQIPRDHPRSIVFLHKPNGAGHAISYFDGLQHRASPLDGYWGSNVEQISGLYVPKDPNRPLEELIRERDTEFGYR